MGNKAYPRGVLCAFIILGCFISSTQSVSCCTEYIHYKIPCQRLVDYTIQNIYGRCNIDAIIFHTRTGRFKCADPTLNWTKDRMRCLNERKKIAI